MIFDGVENEEEIIEYLKILPATTKVLITTRHGSLFDGVSEVKIDPFSKTEAENFVKLALNTITALDLFQKIYPNEPHPFVAWCLDNTGEVYREKKDFEKALQYHLQALNMRKKLFPTEKHPRTAKMLFNIGFIYEQQGKFDESFNFYQEALEMQKSLYPEQPHLDVANTHFHLGNLYRNRIYFLFFYQYSFLNNALRWLYVQGEIRQAACEHFTQAYVIYRIFHDHAGSSQQRLQEAQKRAIEICHTLPSSENIKQNKNDQPDEL